MWTQIVGKVKLELCPFLNQWWEVAFHLTARGLNTGLIPWQGESFEVDFDFTNHLLTIYTSDERSEQIMLKPQTVADFYHLFTGALNSLGIEAKISTLPVEVQHGIRFDQDTIHASYDRMSVHRWWRVMLAIGRAMERFRTPFHGKSSPVQFFWGGFDLDMTRFNGKPTTPPPYGGRIMAFGENEENFAVGFWPGSDQFPHPALYAYMSPAPEKVAEMQIQPATAHYNAALNEFVLLYDNVRQSPFPEESILAFFQSTYEACALASSWDRSSLEGDVPVLKKVD
jgi:hypothetical protein